MTTASIIDLGVGNLGNLKRALESLGCEVTVTDDPTVVEGSRCLLLPGVGAFRPPREAVRGALEDAIQRALARGAWLLGICVGFQLLFDRSVEFGETDGLALLKGDITALPSDVQLPHIGWNPLHAIGSSPLLQGIEDGAHLYFVHSFAPEGVPEDQVLARCTHGRSFAAVCGRGRVMGTQFHPEKSGEVGLRLLANFLEMSDGPDSLD